MRLFRQTLIVLGLIVSNQALATPYSEKDAFCQDQVRGRYYSQYELQKAYNQCMNNANQLIQNYEDEKQRHEREVEIYRKQYEDNKKNEQRKREVERVIEEKEINERKQNPMKYFN